MSPTTRRRVKAILSVTTEKEVTVEVDANAGEREILDAAREHLPLDYMNAEVEWWEAE